MGFLDKVFTSQTEQVDVEDFLNTMNVEEEVVYEDADAYVKSVTLKDAEDVKAVERELKDGNLILLNVEELQKRNAKSLRDMIMSIKDIVSQLDGDVAGVAPGKILVTPARVKIAKRKAPSQ